MEDDYVKQPALSCPVLPCNPTLRDENCGLICLTEWQEAARERERERLCHARDTGHKWFIEQEGRPGRQNSGAEITWI